MSDIYTDHTEKQPSIASPSDLLAYAVMVPGLECFIPLLGQVPASVFQDSANTGSSFRTGQGDQVLYLERGVIQAQAGRDLMTSAGGTLTLTSGGKQKKYSLRRLRQLSRVFSDRNSSILARNLYHLYCYLSLTHTGELLNVKIISDARRPALQYYNRPTANAQGQYQWVTDVLPISQELPWGWSDIDKVFHGPVCSAAQEKGMTLNWSYIRSAFDDLSLKKNGRRIVERYITAS